MNNTTEKRKYVKITILYTLYLACIGKCQLDIAI